jgi:hypothetical protein
VAAIVPDEGLDVFIGVCLKGQTALANTYAGLWTTGATASTVPASTTVLATYTTIGEAAFTSYARQTMAAASWGTTGAKTVWTKTVRGTDGAQVSFPAAGATYSTAINGFFIADASAHGSEHGLLISNFNDTTAIATMALGDIVKVTPTFGLGGAPA